MRQHQLIPHQVALEVYIDEVIKLVIDRHLVRDLHKILRGISSLSDYEIDPFWKNDDLDRRIADKERLEQEQEQLQKVKKDLDGWKENSLKRNRVEVF